MILITIRSTYVVMRIGLELQKTDIYKKGRLGIIQELPLIIYPSIICYIKALYKTILNFHVPDLEISGSNPAGEFLDFFSS